MTRLLIVCLTALGLNALPLAAQGSTTVIVVRHAERAAQPANDPVLTLAGTARAEALLDAVRGAGITHVLVTDLQRTRLTAEPVAQALGLTPAVVSARAPNHVQAVADSIRARAGGVILVVGHSNTVPGIVTALGGTAPAICDDEYDNFYVVTLPASGGATRVIRSRFGTATPVGEGCAAMVPVRK